MNRLENTKAYLAGPIDRVRDDGVKWRKEIRQKCEEKNIPLIFLDPCDKPEELGQEIGDEKKRVAELKERGEECWEQLQIEVKKFKRIDYRMIDLSDMFICYIDISVHMCGSYFEFKVAEEERKPIFIIVSKEMRKQDIPTWLVDLVSWENIFKNVDECVNYLDKINNQIITLDGRWLKVC